MKQTVSTLVPSLRRTKKVPSRRRRSIQRDQEIIAATSISTPRPIMTINAPSVRSLPYKPSPSVVSTPIPANDDAPPYSGAKCLPETAEWSRRRRIRWESTTDIAKVTFANRVLFAEAASVAFTLNLGPCAVAAAKANAKGFVDYFKRRISKELDRKLGRHPLYWFAVHCKGDRPHLHGTIAVNDNDLPKVRVALRVAGGEWNSNQGKGKQVQFKPHYDPDGWARYCLNRDFTAARRIMSTATSITSRLRRAAKRLFEGRPQATQTPSEAEPPI